MGITSEIFQVGGSGLSHSSDAAVYLINSGSEAALIDAGTGSATDRILTNIESAGIPPESIKYLFLTHCHFDHTGGAEAMRQKTGCSIITHTLDADYLESGNNDVTAASWYGSFMKPLKIDIRVTGKEKTFQVGSLSVAFYHTPGHSPGSSVLTVNSDNKLVLFGQDVHGPLNDTLLSNRKEYNESLNFLLTLNADILCEGHFGVYYGREEVRDFIESYL